MAKAWLRRSARQALMYMDNLMVRCRLLPVIMNCSAACVVLFVRCARQVADEVVVLWFY